MTKRRAMPVLRSRRRLGLALILSAGVGLFGWWLTAGYTFTAAPGVGAVVVAASLSAGVAGVILVAVGQSASEQRARIPDEGRALQGGRRVLLGAAASAALLLVVALGAIDGYIWMPEALMPGMAASDIRAQMAEVGELGGSLVMLAVWVTVWGTVSLVPLGLALARRMPLTGRALLLTALAIAATTILFQWTATFSMGMGVADTFGVGGGQSGFWVAYVLLGQLALVGVIGVWLQPFAAGQGAADHPASGERQA